MANELIYQSIFQGAQMDERLTAVASLQEALAAVEQAITAKYTKPASGIPETDLDAAVQSALAKARSAVQDLSNYYSKTEIDALLSAVNSQQYVDVTALPTASADTLGKIYLVGPDANNQYARYYTSYDGSAYSWVAAGTTEINLALYATKAELSQLSQKVTGVSVISVITYNATAGTNINTTRATSGATLVNIPAGTTFTITLSGTATISTTQGWSAYLLKSDGSTSIATINFGGATSVSYTADEQVYYIGFYCLGTRITASGTVVFTVQCTFSDAIEPRLSELEGTVATVKATRVALNSIVSGYYVYKTGSWLSNQHYRVEIYPVTAGKTYYVDVDYGSTNPSLCAFYSAVPTSSSSPISYIPYTPTVDHYVVAPTGAAYIATSTLLSMPQKNVVFETSDARTVLDSITEKIYTPGFENRSKDVLYLGASICTGYYWREYLRDDYNIGIVYTTGGFPAAVGGTPLIPPVTETSGHESIWWRCAEGRLLAAGYAPEVIALIGGFNDLSSDSLVLGTASDTPYVDDSSDFTDTTVDTRPDSLTFCAAMKGCILMLQRDFPNAEIIIPTVMYCSDRGTEALPGDTLIASEAMAVKQIEVAQSYGLRIVPWYWSERNANTINALTQDGIHPTVGGARIMERWFAQYLPALI